MTSNNISIDIEQAITDLIGLTEDIIEYTGQVDETFIGLLEDRNQRFTILQNQLLVSSAKSTQVKDSELSSQDVLADVIEAEKARQQKLQELYRLTKQAEAVIQKLRNDAADNIKKIHKGKQTTDLYEQRRSGRSSAKRNPYQITPDAAFFDKKK